MILSTSQKDATKQKVLSFQEVGQNRKMVIKIEFTPLSLSRVLTLKRILKEVSQNRTKYCNKQTNKQNKRPFFLYLRMKFKTLFMSDKGKDGHLY